MRITGEYHLDIKQNTSITHMHMSSTLYHDMHFARQLMLQSSVTVFVFILMLTNTVLYK